jgi:predicted metalloprotease with PDZ domain
MPLVNLSDMKRETVHSAITKAILLTLVFAAPVLGQSDQLQVDYTVKVASLQEQLFHVTAQVKNIKQAQLDISLPTWTPGWYTIENYGRYLLRFRISDAKGTRLPHRMIHKQTWRVNVSGLSEIKIEFDYLANILALNQAKITDEFAFFTGTELFPMVEGCRMSPSTIRFEVPQGWKIVSALKETSDPMVFTAPDYDTLVDSPTEMGKFDKFQFEVEGKPHYLVVTPVGAFSKDKAQKFIEMLMRIAKTQSAIFGGLPYEKYVYFYFFSRPESNASGALEHANSHVAFAPPGEFATPEEMINTAAHEFFHLWNVKRIRPAEMWPYDYSRENETPLLWVSEGFTNYYAALTLYRAGLINREQFLESVAGAITGVESNEARRYISPADSSVSTWLGYDTPVAFAISYYTQGQNLGALLDLKIRHDTAGALGLDDLMRALYREFYQRGRGFSTEDMIAVVNRLTGRDWRDFYDRYVWGVEMPPYDTILGYAGCRLEKTTKKLPFIGVQVNMTPEGAQISQVVPGSPAARAGFASGDLLLTIDGLEVRRGFQAILQHLAKKLGSSVKVSLTRNGKNLSLDMVVGSREQTSYRIVEMEQTTPDQLKVRESWLKQS